MLKNKVIYLLLFLLFINSLLIWLLFTFIIYILFHGIYYKINFYLAPPIFSKKDKVTGKPLKIKFGQWIMIFFKIISKLKFLRGTFLDPFGYLAERKSEKKLIKDYKNCILEIAKKLSKENYNIAVDIASTPDQIRGFGHVKEKNIKIAEDCQSNLISAFNE